MPSKVGQSRVQSRVLQSRVPSISTRHRKYENLGSLIKPGYYIGMYSDDLDHSALFIHWNGDFNKNSNINYFTAISGNYNGAKVSVDTYSVGKSGYPDLRFGEDNNGFGRTIGPDEFGHILPHRIGPI